jgi:hypothetical protein
MYNHEDSGCRQLVLLAQCDQILHIAKLSSHVLNVPKQYLAIRENMYKIL